jgi:peptidylprolyl isomerase
MSSLPGRFAPCWMAPDHPLGATDKLYIESGHNRGSGLAMAGESEVDRSPRDPTRVFLVLVAVAVVLSVSVVGYVMYDNAQERSTSASDPIEMGDKVLLDYTGMFSNGHVFDTSLLEIATNDALYPKSLTFTLRDNASYAPFDMTAGMYGAEGGTIRGFALGVLGLSVGDTHTIEVLPEDGYAVNPDMVETISLVEHLNGTEVMLESNFKTLFNIEPVVMDFVPHFKWKWDVLVVDVTQGVVTFKHAPDVDQVVYPFGDPFDADDPSGWACVVESFDPEVNEGYGEVVVRHQVAGEDVYAVKGETHLGQPFILSGFDETNETFEVHRSDPSTGYNGEISGRTLYFKVTIISVRLAIL